MLGGILLVAGLIAVAIGVLPAADAAALGVRIAPVLGFVVAITIVAAVAAEAGVFDRLAMFAARAARGNGAVLWALVVVVATASTIVLSLDTTAVLVTPVVVVLARRVGMSPLPFAMTTVWLANTGSLLLPVSNLTNLLAESRADFPGGYVAHAWLPALVAILVPVAILAIVYRRALAHRYEPLAPDPAGDPVFLRTAAIVVVLLVPALAIGDPVFGIAVWIPASIAAVVLVVTALVRRPGMLGAHLLPVPLILFVCGLFLVVTAAGRVGLTELLTAAAGTGEGPGALLRLAGVGTVTANVADNLPAYLALEPVAGGGDRLLALLVSVNAGPLILPWASLATLLWHARLQAEGVHVSWLRFAGLGLIAAPLTVVTATLAILLT